MHIHESTSSAYFNALAESLTRDARSFDHWFILHGTFPPMAAEAWEAFRSRCIHEIREKFAGVTVDVLFLEQPDMFLLSRDLDPKSLGNMAKLMGVENFSVRELSGQSREVLELLHTYCDRTEERIQTPQYPVTEYPEIDSLKEMFATASMQRGCRQPQHVLLVEDDPLTVRMVSSLISGNHATFVAKDAEDAIAQYMLHAPDVVFLDIGLPGTNGFEVLRHIRAIDPHAYVVMFSGNRDLEHICHALSMGARGFIGKPFRKESLHYYLNQSAAYFADNRHSFYAH